MTYLEGFVVPVPTDRKDDYTRHASSAAPMLKDMGVARHYEAWGDDVPAGKLTDFYRSVDAQEGEAVVFSWFEYPDRATRDAANEKMMADPRMEEMARDMPFDGQRMIMGGFESFIDQRAEGRPGYTDGYLLPVPADKLDAYRAMAEEMAGKFEGYGALRVVEAVDDDVPDGKVTDFRRAVQAESGERVVFSFVEWPDKATRDAGWKAMMEDPSMQGHEMPFDGKRMFWGGFAPILDTAVAERAVA